ncbi:MAG: hypothetical protein GX601_18380, partial [Anaerolineales bacterium]|nr:hypothetical protein [Anaerolineales bacterium]
METILLATHQRDIAQYCEMAEAHGAGLEIQVYGYEPDLLDDGWRELLQQQRAVLRGFTGELAVHGAFFDLAPASLDGRVSALALERCRQSLEIAMELGARRIVFHT